MRTVNGMENSSVDRRTAAHSSLTPEQRSQRAKIAARARWANSDTEKGTRPAREAFLARFEAQVDPDGVLDPRERARRAESAKRAHFQRMAYARHRKGANMAALLPVDADARQRAARAQRVRDSRAGLPVDTTEGAQVVYFLRRGDLLKIGTTRNLARRVQSFQHTLDDVVATLPGDERLERVWHLRFSHLRDRDAAGREWFRATGELWEAIAAAVSESTDLTA